MSDDGTPFDVSQLRDVAMAHAKLAFDELCTEHRMHLSREVERMQRAFTARRRIIDRVGLGAVRSHRLHALAEEENAWNDQLAGNREPMPEFNLLLALQVKGGANG